MEPMVQSIKRIHSPLYDRRLMILILKKTNGRRSFSENCRCSKIKEDCRIDRQHEPTKAYTQKQKDIESHPKNEEFRFQDTFVFVE
jgi:hypothetical protein